MVKKKYLLNFVHNFEMVEFSKYVCQSKKKKINEENACLLSNLWAFPQNSFHNHTFYPIKIQNTHIHPPTDIHTVTHLRGLLILLILKNTFFPSSFLFWPYSQRPVVANESVKFKSTLMDVIPSERYDLVDLLPLGCWHLHHLMLLSVLFYWAYMVAMM